MKADVFIGILKANGITQFTGVPCSVFAEVIRQLERHEHYCIVANEGEAMGVAAGVALAGEIPAVLMQNDGFGNSVNPLTSLHKIYGLPALLVISWRGEPGRPDAPQHLWSGKTLFDLLNVFEVETLILDPDPAIAAAPIAALINNIRAHNRIGALVCRTGVFDHEQHTPARVPGLLPRAEAIRTVMACLDGDTAVFSTTGKISRELCRACDRRRNFYVVGSMGLASTIALGFCRRTGRRTAVLDGDGAVLMHLGALATIGFYQPPGFLHVCLDNGVYDSTGGQTAASSRICLSDVARACKYPMVARATTADEIRSFIKDWHAAPRLAFLHISVTASAEAEPDRPAETPPAYKQRFMDALA